MGGSGGGVSAMVTYTPNDVFVPGGMPSVTYVPRADRDLENQLRSVADNLCKLVTLTGSTKSGKTVLANRIFPEPFLLVRFGLMEA